MNLQLQKLEQQLPVWQQRMWYGLTINEQERDFYSAGELVYLALGIGFTGVNICPKHIEFCTFYCL